MISLSRLRQGALGWVYPPACGGCGVPLATERQLARPFLCEGCEAGLTPIPDDYCRVCGQSYESPMPSAFRCANCGDRELAFDFAVSAYRNSGTARELMHAYKYGKKIHLARLMGSLVERVWRDERLRERESWLVVPVPLHGRRLRSRGFNQSREIAAELVRRAPRSADLRLFPALRRTKHTVRQAQLDRKDRLRNPAGAFAAGRRKLPVGAGEPGFLLVDDVITTGSTVSECAAALRARYEPEEIAAISVMRG